MKTLIATLVLTFAMQAQASDIIPQTMTPVQKAQLLNVLNQLEPEALSAVLSEEALEWYIEQYNRGSHHEVEMVLEEAQVEDSRIDFTENPYEDPRAPKFN